MLYMTVQASQQYNRQPVLDIALKINTGKKVEFFEMRYTEI